MRITPEQHRHITGILKKHFGQGSRIWLFGSRINDQAKGGDIDLYLEPEYQSAKDIVAARLAAMAELHQTLGDQRIDLVINRHQGPRQPIYDIAKTSGIEL